MIFLFIYQLGLLTKTIITYDPVVYCDHYHIFPNGET
ncbi:hypothetical protein VP455E521_P0007 [Vibrio phage 455E52-1]|nr:hypothetical protein VP455E521_P0007 [Vibrio phage 455E52-1]